MAPTPLSAPFRLDFLYTVSGFQHRMGMYLDCAPSSDESGYNFKNRTGAAELGLSNVLDPWWTLLAPFYSTAGVTFDRARLMEHVGVDFYEVYSKTTTVVPTNVAATTPAIACCFMCKDGQHRNMPIYLYETAGVTIAKMSSWASMGAAQQAIADALGNANGGATDTEPWNWRQSRDEGTYTAIWLSLVIDSNEKLRRLRGVK